MSAHLHILLPGNNLTMEEMRSHPIASIRLRLLHAATAAMHASISVTVGESAPENTTTMIVGKIGAHDFDQRASAWLNMISKINQTGGEIFLDYTDHHIASNSIMAGFYMSAVKMVDHIIVPNQALRAALYNAIGEHASISVIEDSVEFLPVEPKSFPQATQKLHALWFGHPSNAHFLCDLIANWPATSKKVELLVVSSKQTIDIIQSYPFPKAPEITIRFRPWSPKALQETASTSDFVVIPSSLDSAKRFASNNRLITALTLGLPVLATPLPSYEEFDAYFSPLTPHNIRTLVTAESLDITRISDFQDAYSHRFSAEVISNAWEKHLRLSSR